jgi:hypothetical protein
MSRITPDASPGQLRQPGEEGPPAAPPAGSSAQWGLASLLTGGFVLLVAPMIVLVNISMAFAGPSRLAMNRGTITLATIGFLLGGCLILGLGGMGVTFGIVSLRRAGSRRESIALGLAGLTVSIVGLLVFLFAAIDTGFVLELFNHYPDR